VVRRARLAATLLALIAAVALAADAGGERRPRCFGAASRDAEHPCVNPKLRRMVVPSPKDALDAPNAPCDPVATDAPPYRCTFGSPEENAADTIALIGDSHATHWRSALLTVAARRHWHGVSIARSSCPFTQATPDIPDRRACVVWNRDVLEYLEDHPEITMAVFAQHRGRVVVPAGTNHRQAQIRGYVQAWSKVPRSVRHIFVIRDTPYDRTHTVDCIVQALRRGDDPGQICAIPRRTALKTDPAALAARRSRDRRVQLIDMTSYFCSTALCYPVVGGALVHKDTTHISLTFGTTLGPYLLRAIDRKLR
jgi:hypothetical protein